jgi:magnesium transporter
MPAKAWHGDRKIRRDEILHSARIGKDAGIEHAFDLSKAPDPGSVRVRCFDFDATRFVERTVEDIDTFLSQERPACSAVRWIDVDGLSPQVVDRFRQKYGFHTLAAEDVLHVPQRPRVEDYGTNLFITARMVAHAPDGALHTEQVGMFLFDGLLLTFQELEGDVFDGIRHRLRTEGSRVRQRDASFLTYALLDAIVDHCFPVLEKSSETLVELEEEVMSRASPASLQRIQALKRDLIMLRRIVWPTRDLVDALAQDVERLSETTRTYLRDVHTHTMQLIDVIESHREMASNLVDLYMSVVSNRMNEVMKVLTIIATLFIPITFLAGVYGMNFHHFPELDWPYAYPAFWGFCGVITVSLLLWFRSKTWI